MQLISIDFGTTKTTLTTRDLQNGKDPQVVDFGGGCKNPNETVLRFTEDGREIEEWGAAAWDDCPLYPARTFYEFKPEIGSAREFDVAGEKKNASYLTKTFLTHLREILEKFYNGAPISPHKFTTRIGHPAEWNEAQKTQLLKCAQETGWPNVKLCDEATAAAYYFVNRGDLPVDKPCTFMVFDFGGGTLDVCIMKLDEKHVPEMLAVGGNNGIGGRRFDDCLIEHFKKEILAKAAADGLPPADEAEIRRCCRKLKEVFSDHIRLKNKERASVTIPHLLVLGKEEYVLTLSRTLFEELTESLRQGCRIVISDVIKRAGIEANQIDKVLITGGSSHFYFVRELIKNTLPDLTADNIVQAPDHRSVVADGLGYSLPDMSPSPDTTAPALIIGSPANNATVTSPILSVSGTATDCGRGNKGISTVTVNGISASSSIASGSGTASWNATITLHSGANTIAVVATDGLNNPTTSSITVTYNPPIVDRIKNVLKNRTKVRVIALSIVALTAGTVLWQHFTECPSCHGAGFVKCPYCEGSGKDKEWVSKITGKPHQIGPQKQVDCPNCKGIGVIKCPPHRKVL